MNESRLFLSTTIASGLDLGIMTPNDVIRHVTMDVLAHHLPIALKSRLLSAALQSNTLSAALILETLGINAIAEYAPAPLLWNCVAESATRALSGDRIGGSQSEDPPTRSEPDSERNGKSDPKPAARPVPLAVPPSRPLASPLGLSARKPNHTARASRVRAGATTLPKAVAPEPDHDVSPFEVDTRVGPQESVGDLDVDVDNLDQEDVTAHGTGSDGH